MIVWEDQDEIDRLARRSDALRRRPVSADGRPSAEGVRRARRLLGLDRGALYGTR